MKKIALISLLFQYCFADFSSKTIRVDFSKNILLVEKEVANQKIVEAQFLVALPRKTPKLPVFARVEKIVLYPTWYPTEATRNYYLKTKNIELPKSIPPGHSLNALGVGVINLNFLTKGINPLVKIHGTNDESSIGQRITRGCIRLKNEDFLKLKNLIQGFEVLVIFE